MTTIPEDVTDVNTKLKMLAELMNDILRQSPLALRIFLKQYNFLFSSDNDEVMSTPSTFVDVSSQTDDLTETNEWNVENITEDVSRIAKKVALENGFSYDESTGWYFDHKMNCHYNADSRLYYYNDHKAYYYYDEESNGLKFYCSVPVQAENNCTTSSTEANNTIFTNETASLSVLKDPQSSNSLEEFNDIKDKNLKNFNNQKEEGECSESDEENSSKVSRPVVIEAAPTVFEPKNTKHFAPCIRVIVQSSTLPNFNSGTLFIVTCTGGTIGREGDHDILIPDHLVSKVHSKFQYVCKDGLYIYELIDLGSKNGTFINGKRLSDTLVQSEPTAISHGSIITVGHTDLLCHIHQYDETCSDCTPWLATKENYKNSITLKDKYNLEASFIRKKFGINSHSNTKYPDGYEDRAEIRRKQVGSSHSSEKTETASINEPICKKNKGYALLSKMGWKEGQTLGKKDEGALLEPLLPTERSKNKTGLGCDLVNYNIEKSKKNEIAMKTLERFEQVSEEDHIKQEQNVEL